MEQIEPDNSNNCVVALPRCMMGVVGGVKSYEPLIYWDEAQTSASVLIEIFCSVSLRD